jgi:hypothetical protein
MRIFSKKAFRFHHPAGAEEVPAVAIQSQSFADVPDWVADSAMFKLAQKDDAVTVIESKKDELTAEQGGSSIVNLPPEIAEKVKQFQSLSANDQQETLKNLEIEPGTNQNNRIQQYTEFIQKQTPTE